MFAPRRLPGIQIDVAPPQAVEALPRMDVAVLVGFAATGPLHLPVPIESVSQYAAVFGADAPLAWDAIRGERVLAYLGPAVRAFFANGGRRCWVIRVARCAASEVLWRQGNTPKEATGLPDVATSNRFAMPGVLSVAASTHALSAALAQARCEGSWSDAVQVSSALAQQSFAIDTLVASDSPPAQRFTLRTRFGLRAGDLLQFGETRGVCAYAVVDSVAAAASAGGPLEVAILVCAAFERVSDGNASGLQLLATPGTLDIVGFPDAVPATLFAPPQIGPDSPLQVEPGDPLPANLQSGHWARWRGGGATVWLRIDDVQRHPASHGSPPIADPSLIDARLVGPAWRELGAMLPFALGGVLRAQVLTMDIRAQRDGDDFRLGGAGLTPRHSAPWWAQQTDAEFYASRDAAQADGTAPLPIPASDAPRFPLAREAAPLPLAWIPLGVEPLFGATTSALPQTPTQLERDGLSRFDAELFLDPELAATSVETLVTQADAIRLMRDVPRSLFGLHAALSIGVGGLFNEASLLAIPDAVHLGWKRRDAENVAIDDPQGLPTPAHWRRHRGACAVSVKDPMDGPDFGAFIDCSTRVLQAPALTGPDSPVPPGAYRLSWSDAEPGAIYVLVEATQADSSDAREKKEIKAREIIYRGPATAFDAVTRREGVFLYQVFATRDDDRSDGSNAVVVRVRTADWLQLDPATLPPESEQKWLSVQRAALRLAAATGELFAVLTMPRHFRTAQALRYTMRLRSVRQPTRAVGADVDPEALGYREARALSYGALFHPWLQADLGAPRAGRAATVALATSRRVPRVVPADGVALGVLASRASRRGAWIAPANEPLKDVVALSPQVSRVDWQALQDAQINLLRADPRGLMALSADTLARDEDTDLRPINVRRLLILLRRLALRRGNTYVFEPNGPTLRRAVQRSFNELLTDMFRRGAFAGATAEQSFRVVTDDTINSARDADAGRFVVELRVAPSIPMRFIGVRLAQSGERLTVVEEL